MKKTFKTIIDNIKRLMEICDILDVYDNTALPQNLCKPQTCINRNQ